MLRLQFQRTVRRLGGLVQTYSFRHRPRIGWLSNTGVLALGMILLLGCSDANTGPAPTPAAQLYWSLRTNWHAVNLALTPPYDTVQLTVAAFTATGAPLPSDGLVHFSTNDSTVSVSPTGMVTALSTTGSTQVVASLTLNGVTLTDTTMIRVTETPPAAQVATLSIQPRPDGLDSSKVAFDGVRRKRILVVYAAMATGNAETDTLCNVSQCALLTYFATSDPSIATVDPVGEIVPHAVGHVTLYASTLAYGVALQDSLPFTIGYPITAGNANIHIVESGSVRDPIPAFAQTSMTIGVGGRVGFTNATQDSVVIVFPYQTQTIVISGLGAARSHQLTDTLPPLSNAGANFTARFDSAGTYVVRNQATGDEMTIAVSSGP